MHVEIKTGGIRENVVHRSGREIVDRACDRVAVAKVLRRPKVEHDVPGGGCRSLMNVKAAERNVEVPDRQVERGTTRSPSGPAIERQCAVGESIGIALVRNPRGIDLLKSS